MKVDYIDIYANLANNMEIKKDRPQALPGAKMLID